MSFSFFPPVSSSPGAYPSKEKQLSQSPTQLLVEPNRQVNLTFTHNITNYDTILWYQRSQGDTSLKLIAYVYFTNLNVEKPFEGNFQVSGDGRKTVYLHILNPRHPEDSGEYFGAARIHSYKDGDALIQKPSS